MAAMLTDADLSRERGRRLVERWIALADLRSTLPPVGDPFGDVVWPWLTERIAEASDACDDARLAAREFRAAARKGRR